MQEDSLIQNFREGEGATLLEQYFHNYLFVIHIYIYYGNICHHTKVFILLHWKYLLVLKMTIFSFC